MRAVVLRVDAIKRESALPRRAIFYRERKNRIWSLRAEMAMGRNS
jgi:hypothetical protein